MPALPADRRDLAARSLPLALSLAGRLRATVPAAWRDELPGVAALALCEAARDFDPTRGTPWEKFAAYRVVNALLDFARRLRRRARLLRSAPLRDAPARPEPLDARLDATFLLDRLGPRDGPAARAVHADGLSHPEAARVLGLTPKQARTRANRGLARLRETARA